jgi:hypothetical protein
MHQCLTESIHSKNAFQSGIVAEAYNPSYLGSGDKKDNGSMPTLGKKLTNPYLNQ